jgi:hypothetical protein
MLIAVIGPAWTWSNVLFGIALIPLVIWVSRRFAGCLERSAFLRHVMNDLAGSSLNAAAAFLTTLSEFERMDDQRA